MMSEREQPPTLPTDWTAEQALAVFECLRVLREQLWRIYGHDVQQAWCDQLVHDEPPASFDPDEPF